MATAADNSNFWLTATTRDRVPALPFLSMKNSVLGVTYDLSIVVAGDIRTRSLNKKYRGKNYIPNVLSFPLDKQHGEIFLNLKQAQREHRLRGESYEYFVALLVIHGMLHLVGMAHGSTMEKKEQHLLSKFKIKNRFV